LKDAGFNKKDMAILYGTDTEKENYALIKKILAAKIKPDVYCFC